MAKPLVHEGTRRFWSGKVDTLCGLVLPATADRRWFASKATCPACVAVRRATKGR